MNKTFFKLVSENNLVKALKQNNTETIPYHQKLIDKYKPGHIDPEKGICANCLV
jgi:hypothetical protein